MSPLSKPEADPLLIDAIEAAKRLSISHRTLCTWMKKGIVPCFKEERIIRFCPVQLQAWIAQRTRRADETVVCLAT